MRQSRKLKIILLVLTMIIFYCCTKKSKIQDSIMLPINYKIKKKESYFQDSAMYYKDPNLINFVISDYDRNGIKDSVFLSAKDSIVEFSIILNGKNKIKTTKLLVPMADYKTERKHNFFLFGNDSDTISLIQEYGSVRDKMGYQIYFDRLKNEFIAKYIIYTYKNNKTGEMIEDTIFQNKLINEVNIFKYFND